MNFINIQFFWLVPFILIFMILLYWRARVRRKTILETLLGTRAADPAHVKVSLSRRLFRFILLLAVIALLCTAVARPFWGTTPAPYEAQGRDLIVLFDVSKSMLAEDIKPSRLEHAKWFLRELVEHNSGDRFGLVAFSGNAFLECPLTSDKTSFMQYIDDLDTSSIPLGGTNLQVALETAMQAFKAAEGSNRAIILISDGDELTGHGLDALKELKSRQIPLFIVGLGDPDTPALIPIVRGHGQTPAFMRDKAGKLVKTRLNEKLMRKLAAATGGVFVRSSTANSNFKVIQSRIKQLLPEEYEKGERSRPVERFYYFLTAAALLAGLWLMLSERSQSKVRNFITAFIAAALLSSVPSRASAQESGQEAAKIPFVKKTEPAGKPLQKLVLKPKAETEKIQLESDPVIAYNSGRQLQLANKPEAGMQYEQAINLAESKPEVRAYSFQNLGVIKHQTARQEVGKAMGMVKQQNLDGALRQLDGALVQLKLAEEMYVKSMSTKVPIKKASGDAAKTAVKIKDVKNRTAVNQQILLNDREKIKKLKKMIEELKKQQQKARKKTQQAKDKNQQQKPQKQQQKKTGQQPQNQQQKQQKKDQQSSPNNAQQALSNARNEVKKLQQQAEQLQQEKMQQNAKQADQELAKAQQAERKQQRDAADKHIDKALKYLGDSSSKNNKKQGNNKQQPKKGDNKDQQQKQKQPESQQGDKNSRQLPKPQTQQAAAQPEQQGKELDKKQAAVLLKMMAGNEKKLRQALKERQKEMYKNQQVEKDW
ncbi:VWA domain-containing protein [Lentisphaerota bacterium ZTH]|nr:VWA domain-containing protein [Lentisphaerota bacterium]WET07164.1 VWA domain-containing protein [Lentisphaerota bacterium ZTH]